PVRRPGGRPAGGGADHRLPGPTGPPGLGVPATAPRPPAVPRPGGRVPPGDRARVHRFRRGGRPRALSGGVGPVRLSRPPGPTARRGHVTRGARAAGRPAVAPRVRAAGVGGPVPATGAGVRPGGGDSDGRRSRRGVVPRRQPGPTNRTPATRWHVADSRVLVASPSA